MWERKGLPALLSQCGVRCNCSSSMHDVPCGMQHGFWPPVEPPVAIFHPHRVNSLDPNRLKPWDRFGPHQPRCLAVLLRDHNGL